MRIPFPLLLAFFALSPPLDAASASSPPRPVDAPPDFVPPAREASPPRPTASPFAPGQWRLRHEARGGPRGEGPQEITRCFTAEDLKADPAAPLKRPPPSGGGRGPTCRFGAAQFQDGQLGLPASCRGPMGSMEVAWTGTYTPESFAMQAEMRMGPMKAALSATGTRLGDCPAP